MQNKAAEYRTAINAFRGFAALYVVVYHLRYYTDFNWFDAFPVLRFGYIGVDFFFILSGLIVSHVYLRKSEKRSVGFWKKFIWYRIARLFPVHFLIMLLMLMAAVTGPLISGTRATLSSQDYWDWILLTSLVRQWTFPEGYAWNSPAWSVSAEFFAYLFVFPLITRITAGNMTRATGGALIALGSAILGFIIWNTGTVNVISYVGPLMRVTGGFLIGSGLYLILSSLHKERNWDVWLAASLGFLLVILLLTSTLMHIGISIDAILILTLAAVISMTYLAKGPISRWLSRPGFFWFGEVSFALYLCHNPVMHFCAYLAKNIGWQQGFTFGIFCVVLSFAVAHILYKLVEIPARGMMRGWYDRYQGSAEPLAA